jgi:adenylate cyclase class IV
MTSRGPKSDPMGNRTKIETSAQEIEKELDKDTYHGYGIQNFPRNRSAFRTRVPTSLRSGEEYATEQT